MQDAVQSMNAGRRIESPLEIESMQHEIERTATGCRVCLDDDLRVELDHPHLDKGTVRGTLTVRRGEELVYRDTANLTSERTRQKLINNLTAKGVELDHKLFLALDEAGRRLLCREDRNANTESTPVAQSYQATAQGLVHLKPTKEGDVPVVLTNFTTSIIGELVRDDGVETHRSFELEAHLDGRKSRFDVPASSFHTMGWVIEKLGPRAVVHAGFGAKDHARAAIQLLSGEILSKTVYTHLGWRKIGDEWLYLHAGGPIGPIGPISGIEVEPPCALARYTLPSPPDREELSAAIRSSMQMLDVLPLEVTVPVYCAIWRAATGTCDFSIHISGQTGTGKSELAALAQRHYGAGLDARHLPGSWSSTGNALEVLAFAAKDALLVVDDFAPEGTSSDIQRLHREAARLLRAQGNRSGRQRLRADTTMRPEKHPRGLILSTGEDVPKAHSVRARMLTLEAPVDGMNWTLLSECQASAAGGIYAQSLAGYIQWLSQRYEELEHQRQLFIKQYRVENSEDRSGHKRISMTEAELLFGLHQFLAFAEEAGALTSDDAARWKKDGTAALRQATTAQTKHLTAADPVRQFLELLESSIAAGTSHLVSLSIDLSGSDDNQRQGTRIGWIENDVYLIPEASYQAAKKMAGDESLAVQSKTLWKRMQERGFLASSDAGRNTVRRNLGGSQRRVLHLKVSTLMPGESVQSVQSVPEGGNSRAGGSTTRTDCEREPTESVTKTGPENANQGAAGPEGPIGPILEGRDPEEERDSYLEV